MKIICNSLYRHLIAPSYYPDILFLNNEECDAAGDGYDLSETEMAILQPFYINKQFLEKMPNLKIAQITGAGYDRVDVEEVKKREIILCNTRGVMSVSIAEDVFAKMLFFARKMRRVENDKKEHLWDMFDQDQWMCSCYDDLYQKTLGIMGYGSIGSEIAKRANAFGMKVHVYDIREQEGDYITKCFVGEEQLPEFYGSADYLAVCIPLNEHTRYMLNEKAFQKMKKSAVLINVARGPLVNTKDLVKALRDGQIRGAALDVFEEEPLPADSELWEMSDLYLSSHKAGMGDSWKPFIGNLIMRNIDHYKKKEELENKIQL